MAFSLLTVVGFAQTPSAPAAQPNTGKYTTEAAAKTGCPADTVVWGNTASKVLHPASDPYYGKTKRGAYMCEKAAINAGFHVSKQKQ